MTAAKSRLETANKKSFVEDNSHLPRKLTIG